MRVSRTPGDWEAIYRERYHLYENFTIRLKDLFSDLIKKDNIDAQIEYRTKNIKSFIDKINREGKDYKNPFAELTDLVGIRIICYYLEDVSPIVNIIKNEFEIDLQNSIDKSQTLDPDKFGYLSVHYIISLSDNRKHLTEWKDFANIKAEVQLRTVLQHAWAAIDHKLRYKTAKEVPKELRRKLFRLSALLELADDEFSNLRKLNVSLEETYSLQVEQGELDIEIDLSSLDIYLQSSKQRDRWKRLAEEAGIPKMISDVSSERKKSILIDILHIAKINTLKEFDLLLNEAYTWGKDFINKNYNKISYDSDNYLCSDPYCIISLIVIYSQRKKISLEAIKEIVDFCPGLEKMIITILGDKT